jgi:CheY-like chemotaxis protein
MKTPVVVFPTKSLLIDDDGLYARLFAKNMLRKEGISINLIDTPEVILEQSDNDFLFFPNLNKTHTQIINRNEISNNPSNIQEQLDGAISVLVVDYYMPKINGLEFFEKIKSPFVYKILISNFVDTDYSHEVTEALNNGIINAALDKKRNLNQTLKQSICKGQNKFFSLLSNEIIQPSQCTRMSDPDFSAFIWDTIEKIKPENMFSNKHLSQFQFMHKDASFKQSLFITTPDEITILLEGYQAETVSAAIIEKLASHNFILACQDPFSIEGTEWANFLKPATKIKGSFNNYLVTMLHETIYE